MNEGGCLACEEEGDVNYGPINLEEQFNNAAEQEQEEQEQEEEQEQQQQKEEKERPELFKAPIDLGDCPICFEELKMIDITVTKCGHTFHSSCIFRSLEQNGDCPMCRNTLIDSTDSDDEDEEEQEDDDYDLGSGDSVAEDDDEEDNDEDNEEEPKVTVDQLSDKLQNMGYTMTDVLALHMEWYMDGAMKREDQTRQSEEFFEELIKKINGLVEGQITMSHRDQRTYAQVLQPQPQQQQQLEPQPSQIVTNKDFERILLSNPRRNTQEV
jgi:hypothetical protein